MNNHTTQIGFRAVFRLIVLAVLLAGSGLLMILGPLYAEPTQAMVLRGPKPCKPADIGTEIDKKCRTATPTPTWVPVSSATSRPSPTATALALPTRTATPTSTQAPAPTATATATALPTRTATATSTQPATATSTAAPTHTPVPGPTNMPPATPTVTPVTPAPSSTATATRLPDQAGTPLPTLTSTASPTATPTQAPTEANPGAPEATAQGPSVFHAYLPILMDAYACSQLVPDCYEPNNTVATAADLAVPGITVATIDKALDRYDFYRLTLQGGSAYTFTLTFDQADLDLYLYAEGDTPEATPQLLASSNFTSVGMTEQIRFTPTASGRYYLLVYGFDSPAPVTYQLTLEAS